MKELCIIFGSPRENRTTSQLVQCSMPAAEQLGCPCEQYRLYDMDLRPCTACRTCQKDWSVFGCPQKDDMQLICQ